MKSSITLIRNSQVEGRSGFRHPEGMSELISLYDGPEIPQLRKKEGERKGGGVPPVFLSRGGAGVRLAAGQLGARSAGLSVVSSGIRARGFLGFVGRVLGLHFTQAEAAGLSGLVFISAALLGLVGMSVLEERLGREAGAGRPVFAAPPGAGEAAASGGAAEGFARPGVKDLIKDTPMPEAAPEEAATEDAPVETAPKEAAAPTEGGQGGEAQGEVFREAGFERRVLETKPRLAGAAGGRFGGGELRDGLNSFGGVRSFGNLPPMKELGTAAAAAGAPARRSSASRRLSALRARSTRAMGQLKFARAASESARAFGDAEPARQFATNAFDQNVASAGPSAGGIGLTGGETSGPLGAGAPDLTQPSVGPGVNQTPYQDKVDGAKKDNKTAMMMTLIGLMLLAAGAAAMMLGKKLMAAPDPTGATQAMGANLVKLGKGLLVAGAAMLLMGLMQAKKAKEKGRQVAEEYGQPEQGAIIDGCADEATRPAECSPRRLTQPPTPVREAVALERQSTFQVGDNGGPIQ